MSPTRRILLLALAAIIAVLLFTTYHSSSDSTTPLSNILPKAQQQPAPPAPPAQANLDLTTQPTLPGHAIAPKLGNETAKAELGRATWKYLHTVMARFPDKPSADESAALKTYIYLFQRLYPCGECAAHFGEILNKFPPQVSSRSAAAAWACHVHNEVNRSLDKEIFDCSNIGDFYDCGCAEDGGEEEVAEKGEMSEADKERITGVNGRDMNYVKVVEAGGAPGLGVGVR